MDEREIVRAPSFDRHLKKLEARYKGIGDLVDEMLAHIARHGPGSDCRLITGIEGKPVYKVRAPLPNRGKRGGARIIFYCDDRRVAALVVFAKNAKGDVPASEIERALKALEEPN